MKALVEEKPARETERLGKVRGNLSVIKLNCFRKYALCEMLLRRQGS